MPCKYMIFGHPPLGQGIPSETRLIRNQAQNAACPYLDQTLNTLLDSLRIRYKLFRQLSRNLVHEVDVGRSLPTLHNTDDAQLPTPSISSKIQSNRLTSM